MKISNKLKPGMIVYEIQRQRMGHTAGYRNALYSLVIKEIDPELRWVIASWNGNHAQKFGARSVAHWRFKKPEPKTNFMGMRSY